MRKLVLLGADGNNADILEAVERLNDRQPTFELLGYVTPEGREGVCRDLPWLGHDSVLDRLPPDVCVAGFRFGSRNYRSWPATVAQLGLPAERWATVVDPRASVSRRATVGRGAVVLAGTVVGADVRIGDHVIVLQNATVSHDCVLDDYASVSAGVTFAGHVHVGRCAYVGAGATVFARAIGEGSLVGAGSLVRKDVPPDEVWAGNPARMLRKAV